MSLNVSIDEVYRLVQQTRTELRSDLAEVRGELAEVRQQTTETNGTLGRHEERLRGHDIEIRDLKEKPGKTADGIRIVIPTDGKTILALVLALGAIAAALMKAWGGS